MDEVIRRTEAAIEALLDRRRTDATLVRRPRAGS
jgi:hypothetical protein